MFGGGGGYYYGGPVVGSGIGGVLLVVPYRLPADGTTLKYGTKARPHTTPGSSKDDSHIVFPGFSFATRPVSPEHCQSRLTTSEGYPLPERGMADRTDTISRHLQVGRSLVLSARRGISFNVSQIRSCK